MIRALEDSVLEGDESFTVRLLPGTSAAVIDPLAGQWVSRAWSSAGLELKQPGAQPAWSSDSLVLRQPGAQTAWSSDGLELRRPGAQTAWSSACPVLCILEMSITPVCVEVKSKK